MSLSVISIVVDLLSVTPVIPIGVINPFWKFAFIFKCFTDSIILDDFKAALDKLSHRHMSHILPFNIAADNESGRRLTTYREGKMWPRSYSGSVDTKPITEAHANSGRGCVELADVGGLCPPSPATASHIEDTAARNR